MLCEISYLENGKRDKIIKSFELLNFEFEIEIDWKICSVSSFKFQFFFFYQKKVFQSQTNG